MPPTALTTAERIDWLRLIRSENVGPVIFRQLLRRFGSAAAALEALPHLARRGGRSGGLKLCSRAAAEAELEAIDRLGGRLIAQGEPDYPVPLAGIEDAPPLIGLLGHAALLRRRTVAIVGARNASANGRRLAETIAQGLSAAGCPVASGLARGIDTAAHRGALKAEGGTVAVVAGGLDIAYPPENAELMAEIARKGVVIAENPPGVQPQARHFPRRNRIISGLSLGVVVVEAAAKSGSLITARMALDQGREVFAVPGSPLDPRCRGSNGLIRQGAGLVESAEDVLDALPPLETDVLGEPSVPGFSSSVPPQTPPVEVEKAHRLVLELLGPDPVEVDELIRQCQLSAAAVLTVLLEIELAGRLERHPGQRVSLLA